MDWLDFKRLLDLYSVDIFKTLNTVLNVLSADILRLYYPHDAKFSVFYLACLCIISIAIYDPYEL